jgi:Serine protease inhibitor
MRKINSFSAVKKSIFTVVSAAAAAAVLAASMSGAAGKAGPQDLMNGVKAQKVNVSGAVTQSFLNSTQSFSANLFKETYQSGANTLVSPTSAYLALGMAANGASGTTRKAFQKLLGKYGLSADDLNKAYKSYADALTQKRGDTTLTIANSIWFNSTFSPNKSFLQQNADYFGATAKKLDFTDKNAVNEINSWVKSKTGGKIDKILDKLKKEEVMHLLDALYFKAKWTSPFDQTSSPYSGSFNPESGGSSKVTYMSLESSLAYAQRANETAVVLPYNDKRFAMLLILPDKSIQLSKYVADMSENTIPDIVGAMKTARVNLTLPQFKVESDSPLDSALKGMGLGVAYGDSADFSKIGTDKKPLCITSVHQKTYLDVDELGTEAGAVTDIGVGVTALPVDLKKLVFNRPFVYAVIDTKTNLPLFIGAMEKPVSTLKPRETAQEDNF